MSERILDHLVDANSLDLGPLFGERRELGLVKDLMRGSLAAGAGAGACRLSVSRAVGAVSAVGGGGVLDG
jgi:hypothetical protein